MKMYKRRAEIQRRDRERYAIIKFVVYYYYSNGEMCCNCCEEHTLDFLCMDHINGGGTKQYKGKTPDIKGWLYRRLGMEGFQVLCHNCNISRRFHDGKCIHEIERERAVKNLINIDICSEEILVES